MISEAKGDRTVCRHLLRGMLSCGYDGRTTCPAAIEAHSAPLHRGGMTGPGSAESGKSPGRKTFINGFLILRVQQIRRISEG